MQNKDIEVFKDKKENKQDNILSSVDLEGKYKHEQRDIEQDENKNNLKEGLFFLARFILSFAQFIFVSYAIILFCIVGIFAYVTVQNGRYFLLSLWGLICGCCTGYTLINYFFLDIENDYVRKLYQDGIFFILSALLTFAFLKAHQKIGDFSHEIFGCFNNLIALPFNYATEILFYKLDYFIDYYDFKNDQWPQQLNNLIQFFTVLDQKQKDEDPYQILSEFKYYKAEDNYNFQNFSILTLIILIKLAGVFYFINIHSQNMTVKDIVDMTLIILVYIFISYNLLRTLGSYDLIRKVNQMNRFKDFIDFQNVSKDNYMKKIDITSPQLIEQFDNGRKLMLNTQLDYLGSIELSYLCLVFYYFFVIIICVSYFFDLDWLIQANSPLLNPLQVIMSTGNFVFLSAFLIFRFKHGTDFNNSFSELELQIDHSLDLVDDLMTMYNSFFLEKKRDIEDEERFSAYFLLTKKIKLLSKNYIENKIQFQHKIFKENDKDKLRLLILRDMKQSLEKIKKSVQSDFQLHTYKFMNIIDVDYNSFLFTILIGVATTLPQIIPKFIVFFKKE